MIVDTLLETSRQSQGLAAIVCWIQLTYVGTRAKKLCAQFSGPKLLTPMTVHELCWSSHANGPPLSPYKSKKMCKILRTNRNGHKASIIMNNRLRKTPLFDCRWPFTIAIISIFTYQDVEHYSMSRPKIYINRLNAGIQDVGGWVSSSNDVVCLLVTGNWWFTNIQS